MSAADRWAAHKTASLLAAPAALSARDLGFAALCALASLLPYVLFGQGILYGDGAEFLVLLRDGAAGHKNHLAYLPLLRAFAALGAEVGWSPFVSARAASQVGTALGVGVFFLASRRFGLRRGAAAWLTALIATTPSVLFFATVVEVHAPYFACLALAWLATAHLAQAPSMTSGALLGGACGLAYTAHASGLLLPAPLLLVAAVAAGKRRRLLRPALACLAVHAAIVTVVPWTLSHAGHVANPLGAGRFLAWWKIEVFERPATLWLVLWDEWLLAYLPVSLLWLRAFLTMPKLATLAAVVLLPYLLLSVALLASYREFGAYQQAVLWLFCWVVVRNYGAAVRLGAVVVAATVGVARVVDSDDRQRVSSYAAGLAELAGSVPPLLLIGDVPDFEHCFIADPDAPCVNLASPRFAEAAEAPSALAHLDATIAAHRGRGGRTFLTSGAIGFVSTSAAAAPESGFAVLMHHLQTNHRLQIAVAQGFRSYELLPPQ